MKLLAGCFAYVALVIAIAFFARGSGDCPGDQVSSRVIAGGLSVAERCVEEIEGEE